MQKKQASKITSVLMALIILPAMILAQGSPNVPLLVNVNQYPSAGYNDCWGYTAPDGREYALLGVETGTSIIDITDAPTVTEIAFIPSSNSLWKDIKTYQHYAYVVTDANGNGMQIIDLSDLPNSATLVGTYTGFSTSHNIYIDITNAMLYAEGSSSQPVRTISLANPLSPTQISFFGIECHDVYVQDNKAYVSEGNSGSYGIYDVSNPNVPSLLQRLNVPSAGYCHNAWVSEDGNYMMTTEETTGKTIKVWDISNLSNITLTDNILAPTGLAHNTHLKGDYAYVSHYADGLRIYDISDPSDIFEAGYYDSYASPGGGFVGAWGAFPFFASGKVLISDMQTGLYVVFFAAAEEVGLNPASLDFDTVAVNQQVSKTLHVFNPASDTLVVSSIVSTQAYFSAAPLQFSVASGDTQAVTVTFTPLTAGQYNGVLTIATNFISQDTLQVNVTGYADQGVGIGEDDPLPQEFAVSDNYPNPFNPSTTIDYQLSRAAQVHLTVYNSLGQKIRTLVRNFQQPGSYQAVWDGRNDAGEVVGSGMYLYRFTAGNFSRTHKMFFMK